MGLFSGLFSKKEKKRHCLICGEELNGDTCPSCGRQDKPLVPLSALNWSKVPVEAIDAVGEQNEPGQHLSMAKEMAMAGELYIADIYVDKVLIPDEDDDDVDLIDILVDDMIDLHVQFSTPDLSPCDTECLMAPQDAERMEELLESGRHDAKILWGRRKKNDYYYVFVPQSDDITEMFDESLIMEFISFGVTTQERTMP